MAAGVDNSISVDEWISKQREDFQPLLRAARAEILAGVPDVEERMSYGVPTYRVGKVQLGAIGTAKGHCSLYGATAPVREALADDLAEVKVVGATVHFGPGDPLPDGLAAKVMRASLEGG